MAAKIIFTGVKDIDRKLNQLGSRLANKIATQSMRAAMKPLVPAIKTSAPVGETRRLSKSPKIRAGKRSSVNKSMVVYIDKDSYPGGDPTQESNGGFYAVFQEFGTRNIAGKGYMRKVYDMKKNATKQDIMRRMMQGIEGAVK